MERQKERAILIGDAGVGKTTLSWAMAGCGFSNSAVPTVGASVTTVTVEVDGSVCSFDLWDTAGQELYRSIVPMYFKNVKMVILVLSLTDRKSFEGLDKWLEMVDKHGDATMITTVLVANKSDFPESSWEVSESEIRDFAAQKELNCFIVSAKTQDNVEGLNCSIAQTLNASEVVVNEGLTPGTGKKTDGCC